MKLTADLHIHSKYSRAVSKKMTPENIAEWASLKGIDLVASGDWTHPLWLKELEKKLKVVENGIFKLKSSNTKFILSTEISSIYSQGNKSRRIHNLVLAPSFKTVHRINDELKRKGCNLMSDGRPIIGLSSIELAELVWSIDKDCFIIPAHIWTPWYAMFGSKSGFDSIKECWGKYSDRIYAIETGLSSDPAMNWRIKELDNRSIVSFSDAHSPPKLGREVTVFRNKNIKSKKNFSFSDLTDALKQDEKGDWKIAYTVEFYPEEGKYHYSGHRKCKIRQSPKQTQKKGAVCPVCGKPLTLGVMHRVEELADREKIKAVKKENDKGTAGYFHPRKKKPPYLMLVPLQEILSESLGVGVKTKTVQNEYKKLTTELGSELEILTQKKIEDIEQVSGMKISEGVQKVRKGDIIVIPGFDGVFGKVKIWGNRKGEEEMSKKGEQKSLF